MIFLEIEEVVIIHELMLKIGKGRAGVHDFALLHSAMERPKASFGGKFLYPTIWLMAAALLHSLVKNHPFEDGNKRTAFFSTLRFLNKNSYDLLIPEPEIIKFMVEVDVKNKTVEEIAKWLQIHAEKII